jgi:anti-sigma regulatory factor (Ser/Thr protein kinase)
MIPSDPAYLPVVRAAVFRTAGAAGFGAADAEAIASAAEEAVLHIIAKAFPPGAEETIALSCAVVGGDLVIRIREHGIPFDPEESRPPLPRCRAAADRLAFENLGWGGKETVLARRLAAPPARPPCRLAAPLAPAGAITIRPARADEAVEISRCAYHGYGYSYGYEKVYHPGVLKALIRSGDLLSFIAVDGETVAGHAGLLFSGDPGVAEIALGFVNPPYRSRRVFSGLMAAVVGEAERRQLTGLSGQAVCTHLYSQQSAWTFGMRECALLLSRYTPLRFSGIADENRLRESILAVFRYLCPPPFPALYPPERHAGIIREIYDGLGVHPPYGRAAGEPYGRSVFEIAGEPYGTAQIHVRAFGIDLIPRLRLELARLRAERVEAAYIHLPLTDPATSTAAPAIEELGFFFAGLHLTSGGGDLLILQYLNNQILDYDSVLVASAFGNRLKDYIRERDPWQELR